MSVGFGVGLSPAQSARHVLATARLVEELGYDRLWLTDSHLAWREVYTLLGSIAVSTTRIGLGPGVSHLAGRHPSVIASALATLDELAPGRIRLGIGVGDTGAHNLGVARATLRELESAVLAIRGLLDGQPVDGPTKSLRLGYAPVQHLLPIYVAASGPRTQHLAGRVADGALISGSPAELKSAIENVRAGEGEAGRPPGSTRILFWTTLSVDTDRERARAAVRGGVGRRALNTLAPRARAGTLDQADRTAYQELQRQHDAGHHQEADYAPLVPEEWIDRFAIAGTPEEVRVRLQSAVGDGADEIATILMGPRPGDRGAPEQLTRFAETVLQPMRDVPSTSLPGRFTTVASTSRSEERA